jgi:serine acetyltransferase
VRIADDIVVGAGAVVLDDLAEPGVYAGVPARRLK